MKNRLIALFLGLVAVLSLAGCNLNPHMPMPEEPTLQDLLDQCGPDCKVVSFNVDLLDEDKRPVNRNEGFSGTTTINAVEAGVGPDASPVNVEAWNSETKAWQMTPFDYELDIPGQHVIVAPPNIIQFSIEVLASVPAGYTLKCRAEELAPAILKSEDEFENTEGIVPGAEGAMGIPVDGRVFCSWPGVPNVIPTDLDDIT